MPFSFKIVAKDDYGHYNFNYFSPYTGIVINLKREKLGNLFGGFFAPTCIFALLSMISFLIHPEVVRYEYNYRFSKNIHRYIYINNKHTQLMVGQQCSYLLIMIFEK